MLVETAWQLLLHCQICMSFLRGVHTIYPRIYPGNLYKNHTMLVQNVNIYAIARIRLRWLKTHKVFFLHKAFEEFATTSRK